MWNVIAVTSCPYGYKNPAGFCQFSFPFATSNCADQVNHHRSHRCCHCLRLYQHQIHCILVVMPPKRSGANPESILYKTVSGCYRAYPDGLKTAQYRFKKNASWEKNCMKPILASELFIVLGKLEKQMCNVRNLEPKWWTSEETAGLYTTACMIVLQAEWTS